jgi:deoxycytidylate deaminase
MPRIGINKGYFRLARNTSRYSECGVRVGAVIAKKSPISVGFNVNRTHPRYNNPDMSLGVSIHAEMAALISAGMKVDGCDIYVYRELDSGIPGLAKPCGMCYNELKKHGIKKIYYSIGEFPYWKCVKV